MFLEIVTCYSQTVNLTISINNHVLISQLKLLFSFFPDVFQALLGIPHMDASHSFESLNEEEAVAIAGSSRGIPSLKPLPPEEGSVQTSLSPTRSLPTTTDRSPEISSYFDDMALSDVS